MGFTPKETRRFRMRKYIREHLFDFALGLLGRCLFAALAVYLGGGTKYVPALLLAAVWSLIRAGYSLRWYQKDYLEAEHPDLP